MIGSAALPHFMKRTHFFIFEGVLTVISDNRWPSLLMIGFGFHPQFYAMFVVGFIGSGVTWLSSLTHFSSFYFFGLWLLSLFLVTFDFEMCSSFPISLVFGLFSLHFFFVIFGY